MKKTISTILILITVCLTSASFTAYADNPTSTPAKTTETTPSSQDYYKGQSEDLKNATFNVKDLLNLGPTNQPQKYLNNAKSNDPNTPSPVSQFILDLINTATKIIGSIAIIILIIAGFLYMIARGDQTKLDKAKETFIYALIGLLITFLSYLIVVFVQSVFITAESPKTTSAYHMLIANK
ncbi:hypothetical protein HZC20_02110 [Candidatus Peregrinibacteria bacterium]|nr:hypothetical protein [Candidatus Peregrinibacteria bacterium]